MADMEDGTIIAVMTRRIKERWSNHSRKEMLKLSNSRKVRHCQTMGWQYCNENDYYCFFKKNNKI